MRLATFVFVTGPDGATHQFGPDSELPDWLPDAVTNPKAWVETPEVETPITEPEVETPEVETPARSGRKR